MKHIFRSDEVYDSYQELRRNGGLLNGCVLCGKTPLKQFQYWFIAKNDFPYDRIAKVHNMLIPIRHIDETGLSEEEMAELFDIKSNYLQDYDFFIEAARKKRSVPKHFHVHLIAAKV